MYANAGGVTVSYFEWVKNVNHMRFGRLQRRREEAHNSLLLAELERRDNQNFSSSFKLDYIKGAGELDLVKVGLDDTMRGAYNKIRETLLQKLELEDLRTAAFYVAIQDIALHYRSIGL